MKGAREVKQTKKKIGERKKQRNKRRVKLRPVLVVCCEQTLEFKLIHLRDHMMMTVTAIRNVGGEWREVPMNRQESGPEHTALCALLYIAPLPFPLYLPTIYLQLLMAFSGLHFFSSQGLFFFIFCLVPRFLSLRYFFCLPTTCPKPLFFWPKGGWVGSCGCLGVNARRQRQ